MTVTGFSHLSVQVRNIDKVLPFYQQVLGLQPSVDREVRFSARNPEGGTTDFHRREVYLRWEERYGASYVVLGQHFAFEPVGQATPLQEIGFDHVSFLVDDVDATTERAREFGAELIVEPKTNGGEANGYPGEAQVRTALMYDPERNIVQIDQWL